MAIIKIKNIKTNLGKVIAYVQNREKTEHGILVNTINCMQNNAYQEMVKVKKVFNKEDGILAYHIIQSFKGYEVSPEEVNEIGMSLVNQLYDPYLIQNRIYAHRENSYYDVQEKNIYVKTDKNPILSDKYLNYKFTNASAKLDLGLLMANQNPFLIFLVILLQAALETKMQSEQNKPKYETKVIKAVKIHEEKKSPYQKECYEIKEEIDFIKKTNIKSVSELTIDDFLNR